MSSPLDAPPISRALVTDDTLAVVLDGGLPAPEVLIVPLLRHLISVGLSAERMRIVTGDCPAGYMDRLAEALPDDLDPVELIVHDPTKDKEMAYLANTKDGRRVYLNRKVIEADAFVVVGRAGFDPQVGVRGTASDLFPSLGNEQAQFRSQQLAAESGPQDALLRQRQACDEVAWLAGLFYALAVSLNRDNEVEQVWFGHYESVQQAAERFLEQSWTIEPPGTRPDLVVATLSASDHHTTWGDAAAALELASNLLTDQGKLLLVTDLSEAPGPAGHVLMETDSPWDVLAKLREVQDADTVPFAQCARAMSACRVHLMSAVDANLLEQMSIVPVASVDEVQTLVDRAERIYVLEDADRCRVQTNA